MFINNYLFKVHNQRPNKRKKTDKNKLVEIRKNQKYGKLFYLQLCVYYLELLYPTYALNVLKQNQNIAMTKTYYIIQLIFSYKSKIDILNSKLWE